MNPFEIPFGNDPQEPYERCEEKDPEVYDAHLGDNEGENSLDCGCKLIRSYRDKSVFLLHCPLHAEAHNMVESIGLLLGVLSRNKDGDLFIPLEAEARVEKVEAVLDRTHKPRYKAPKRAPLDLLSACKLALELLRDAKLVMDKDREENLKEWLPAILEAIHIAEKKGSKRVPRSRP